MSSNNFIPRSDPPKAIEPPKAIDPPKAIESEAEFDRVIAAIHAEVDAELAAQGVRVEEIKPVTPDFFETID